MCAAIAPPDGTPGFVRFECTWRREGRGAASVALRGEVDIATAALLHRVLDDALQHARLVLVNLRETSFMDLIGLHVLLDASARAREAGARVLLAMQSRQIDTLLDLTGARAAVHILPLALPERTPASPPAGVSSIAFASGEEGARQVERWIRPLDNPVNAAVVVARAMAVPDRWLWLQAADGNVLRAWVPGAEDARVPAGTPIEVYLDGRGAVNGWREPKSGVAINQRRLATGPVRVDGVPVACQGPCGVVWRVPAPTEMARHDEHCLTCAGPLAFP